MADRASSERRGWKFALLGALAPALLLGVAGVDRAAAAQRLVPLEAPDVEAERFWTPERMAEAEPLTPGAPGGAIAESAVRRLLEGPLAASRGSAPTSRRTVRSDRAVRKFKRYPQRTHGALFGLDAGGREYSCSATLVSSRSKKLIFTAGHCVYQRDLGSFASALAFVPAYKKGRAPYGAYYAKAGAVPSRWRTERDPIQAFSWDTAALRLEERPERKLGARGVKFNKRRKQGYDIFGYPARPSPPYNGEKPIHCRTASYVAKENQLFRSIRNPSTIAGPCYMQQGSSGGGWIIKHRFLNSVVSHGFCDASRRLCGLIHGPYFGRSAKRLYRRVGGGGKGKPTDSRKCKRAKRRIRSAKRQRERAERSGEEADLEAAKSRLRSGKRMKRRNRC